MRNLDKAAATLELGETARAWGLTARADRQIAEALIALSGLADARESAKHSIARAMASLEAGVATAARLPPGSGASLRRRLKQLSAQLGVLKDSVGPLRAPTFVFDPAGFDVIAHVAATALLAQPCHLLIEQPRHFGSGIYAIFYKGPLPFYAPIRGSNTPIYVGSAAPAHHAAENPEEQGGSLAGRIGEHRDSIKEVEGYALGNLKVSEFDYRYLVVKSGWELAGESYLIRFFKPLWNKETKVCTGIGKHGDASTTRANRRSKWDTVHPGRPWTITPKTRPNAKTAPQIQQDIENHLVRHPPKELEIADILKGPTPAAP